jgi:hypothetical protein
MGQRDRLVVQIGSHNDKTNVPEEVSNVDHIQKVSPVGQVKDRDHQTVFRLPQPPGKIVDGVQHFISSTRNYRRRHVFFRILRQCCAFRDIQKKSHLSPFVTDPLTNRLKTFHDDGLTTNMPAPGDGVNSVLFRMVGGFFDFSTSQKEGRGSGLAGNGPVETALIRANRTCPSGSENGAASAVWIPSALTRVHPRMVKVSRLISTIVFIQSRQVGMSQDKAAQGFAPQT